MFPKNRRIPRDMFPLLSSGKTFRNDLFLLKTLKIQNQSRFCFSVSKKISKKAVIRNKIRRMGYRALKTNLSQIKTSAISCFYFKMIPKDKNDLEEKLLQILKDSKLLK